MKPSEISSKLVKLLKFNSVKFIYFDKSNSCKLVKLLKFNLVKFNLFKLFKLFDKFISSKLRIFAGICLWKFPTPEEKQIKVEKVKMGEIAFGKLILINKTS